MNIPEKFNHLEINEEFEKAFKLIEENKNVLISGAAGVGKSCLVEILKDKEFEPNKNTVCLAPTGVAAVRIGGQTIHSFFNFPPNLIKSEHLTYDLNRRELMNTIDRIIIDEIFMVRVDVIDGIDTMLKEYRSNNEPFGGVQMIFVGDLYQLPPIPPKKGTYDEDFIYTVYDNHYFFNAKTYNHETKFHTIELRKVYRQANSEFSELLNRLRRGLQTKEDIDLINNKVIPESNIAEDNSNYIYLATTNAVVDRINMRELEKIPELLICNTGKLLGDATEKTIQKNFLVPYNLYFKKGAKIMMLLNNLPYWSNGTLGIIVDYGTNFSGDDYIKVKIEHNIYEVLEYDWGKVEYRYDKKEEKVKEKKVGGIKQFPLKLAYSVTVHKSQGQTFDAGYIDFGKYVFAEGMTYVALSRFRNLEKIGLKRHLRHSDVKVNLDVANFLKDKDVLDKQVKR